MVPEIKMNTIKQPEKGSSHVGTQSLLWLPGGVHHCQALTQEDVASLSKVLIGSNFPFKAPYVQGSIMGGW